MQNAPLHALRNHLCILRDRKICGVSLEESVASPFAQSHGAVDSISSPYGTLEAVLGTENFSPSDSFLDVGCGKGRPLAYLVSTHFPGKLSGIEINPPVAEFAQTWAERYPRLNVMCGDVFELDITPYNVFFIWYSMEPSAFARWVEKMEQEAIGKVRLYHLSDEYGGDYPEGRPGWELVRRGWVYRYKGLPQHGKPQRFSVWTFDPLPVTL